MAEQVLIVGAGPTGLTLGIELARHGVQARIVEKRAEQTETSRALGVFARTLEQLDRLNLAERLIERGRKLRGAVVHADGKVIATISADELDSPFNFILSVPQSQTERLLEEEALRLGVRIDRQVELVDLEARDDSVFATLRDANGNEQVIETTWLVGCDGAHSAVRHAQKIPYEGEDIDRWFMFADAEADWQLNGDRMNMFLAPQGIAAAMPLPGNHRWRVIVSLPEGKRAPDSPSLDDVQDAFVTRSKVQGELRNPTWTTSFTIRQRLAKRFRAGRVFLAGDAAHCHSPAGGQGMNTGIQDAGNLAWKLAMVVRGAANETLLDTYEKERRPVAKAIVRGTGLLTKTATLSGSVSQAIRNQIADIALDLDFVERRAIRALSELDVGYQKSILSMSEPGGLSGRIVFGDAPQAGERAPIVIIQHNGEPLRISRLFSSAACTVLLFDCESDHGAEQVGRLSRWLDHQRGLPIEVYVVARANQRETPQFPGLSTVIDIDGEVHRRYGIDRPVMYGIRPDGIVGFRATPIDEKWIEQWIARVTGSDVKFKVL